MRTFPRLALVALTASLLMAQSSDDEDDNSTESSDQNDDNQGRYDDEDEDGEGRPSAPPSQPAAPKTPPAPAKTPGKPGEPAKPGAAPAPAKTEMSMDYQVQAWGVVNATAARINDCLQKHLEFQPTAVGSVELSLDIAGDGRMLKVATKSTLPGSEKLQQCLKFIAQSWKFPAAPGVEKFSTALQIRVQKGQPFTLAKPGEKPPANKPTPDKAGESGFLGFRPSWGNGYYQ